MLHIVKDRFARIQMHEITYKEIAILQQCLLLND